MQTIPGSERSLGGGNGNQLQYPCLENPMGGRPWWITVHGVTKSQIRLSMHACMQRLNKETIFIYNIDVHSCSVTQSCPTLCDPMDCNPPGSSVHGISQARILEWGTISSSKESSWPSDQTQVSCITSVFFTIGVSLVVQMAKSLNTIHGVAKSRKWMSD